MQSESSSQNCNQTKINCLKKKDTEIFYKQENDRLIRENKVLTEALDKSVQQAKKMKLEHDEEIEKFKKMNDSLVEQRDQAVMASEKLRAELNELSEKIENQKKANAHANFRQFCAILHDNN